LEILSHVAVVDFPKVAATCRRWRSLLPRAITANSLERCVKIFNKMTVHGCKLSAVPLAFFLTQCPIFDSTVLLVGLSRPIRWGNFSYGKPQEIRLDGPYRVYSVDNFRAQRKIMRMFADKAPTVLLGCDPLEDVIFALAVSDCFQALKGMLATPGFDPSLCSNIIFSMAVQYRHMDVFHELLAHPKVDPFSRNELALDIACSMGNLEVAEVLLKNPRLTKIENKSVISSVLRSNRRESIQLAENSWSSQFLPRSGEQQKILSLLMASKKFEVSLDNNGLLMESIREGDFDSVGELVDFGFGLDVSLNNFEVIGLLVSYDRPALVKKLMSHPTFNPRDFEANKVKNAVDFLTSEMFDLLVDFPTMNQDALADALVPVMRLDIAQRIIAHPGFVSARADWYNALKSHIYTGEASMGGKYRILIGHGGRLRGVEKYKPSNKEMMDIFKLIFSHPELNLGPQAGLLLREAVENNNLEVAQLLVAVPECSTLDARKSAFSRAPHKAGEDLILLLLDHPDMVGDLQILESAARGDFRTLLKKLLDDERLDLSPLANPPLMSEENEYFFRGDPNPLAAAMGADKPECIKILMNHPRYPIAPQGILPDLIYSRNKEVYSMVVSHPRFDPSIRDNSLLFYAARFGRLDAVETLMKLPKVDPSARNSGAIYSAFNSGELEVVERLLIDPRVDPSNENNSILVSAILTNNEALAKLLLANKFVVKGNLDVALAAASYRGYLNLLKAVLATSNASPLALDCLALRLAVFHHRTGAAELLASDIRVKLTIPQIEVRSCFSVFQFGPIFTGFLFQELNARSAPSLPLDFALITTMPYPSSFQVRTGMLCFCSNIVCFVLLMECLKVSCCGANCSVSWRECRQASSMRRS